MEMNKKIFKECLGYGIDKFISEFTLMKKGDKYDLITYSEEFENVSEYGKEIAEAEHNGWNIVYEGNEEDIYAIRAVEEDGENIDKIYKNYYE